MYLIGVNTSEKHSGLMRCGSGCLCNIMILKNDKEPINCYECNKELTNIKNLAKSVDWLYTIEFSDLNQFKILKLLYG